MAATVAAAAAEPWVERYRPRTLGDVAHQGEVVATLQNAVATGRLPHCLFYGPPGSGKTSVALALCRQLWSPDQWRRRVLELNASDERGIAVVRDKIKHFASLAVARGPASASSSARGFFQKRPAGKATDGMEVDAEGPADAGAAAASSAKTYPNPPFKIIILDEADTMTPDAQAALRRIIEAHSRITRFVLVCNYVTRIIEPLASRCAKFRFQPLPPAAMRDRLAAIARDQDCAPTELALLDDVLAVARGDMRRAVTTLQSVHALARGGASATAGAASPLLDAAAVAEIAGLPPAPVLRDLYAAVAAVRNGGDDGAGGGDSSSSSSAAAARPFADVQAAVERVTAEGYAAPLLLAGLLDLVRDDAALDDAAKARIAVRMAEAEKNMVDGADEELQLMRVCSLIWTSFGQRRQEPE